MGIDQGVVPAPEEDLINIHGQGYFGAFEAGAPVVMVGFFGWQDRGENVADQYLITEVLKNKIGFDGMVLSDWNAISFVPGCTVDRCPESVNAGVDMFMVPFDFRAFVANTVADVDAGLIPISRIDDAVTRILRTKLRGGLFHLPKPSERQFANDQDAITDRSLARRAVRESLVLLKNNDNVLPLPRDVKVLLVGKSGDSIQNQTGGWSRTWQGGPAPFAPDDVNLNSDFPSGQSILGALRETVGEDNVTFSADASGVNVADFDVAIAAVGELPYAEFFGDVATADGNWRDPTNQQGAHDLVGEGLHPAVGVVDDEPLARAEQLVRDHQRADGVVAGTAAGIADHVGVALREPGEFGRVKAGIHAGEDGKAARRRHRQFGPVAELVRIAPVRGHHLVQDLAHVALPPNDGSIRPAIDRREILPDVARAAKGSHGEAEAGATAIRILWEFASRRASVQDDEDRGRPAALSFPLRASGEGGRYRGRTGRGRGRSRGRPGRRPTAA